MFIMVNDKLHILLMMRGCGILLNLTTSGPTIPAEWAAQPVPNKDANCLIRPVHIRSANRHAIRAQRNDARHTMLTDASHAKTCKMLLMNV